MAGTIEVSTTQRWSAAGWLFDWVLNRVAQDSGDDDLVGTLREIVDFNLGWLSLADLDDERRARVVAVLAGLPAAAALELPADLPGRGEALEHLRVLAALARDR